MVLSRNRKAPWIYYIPMVRMVCSKSNHCWGHNFSISISPSQLNIDHVYAWSLIRFNSSLTCTKLSQKPPTLFLEKYTRTTAVKWEYKESLKNYSYLLQVCASKALLNHGKMIHGYVLTSGLDPDSYMWICLVDMYVKCRGFSSARRLLDIMPKPDVVSWTALIAAFVSQGNHTEGISLYCQMRMGGVLPNGFTFASVLKACSMGLVLELGEQVHVQVTKLGFLSDVYVGSALVDLYAKCGEMTLAENVFSCMSEKNVVSWNALLNGYILVGDGKQVLQLFGRMTDSEMRLNNYNLSSVVKVCASLGNVKEGKGIHSLAIRIGTELDHPLSSSLVDMYSNSGMINDAYKVFARIKSPDVVSWNAIVACLNHKGYHYEAANCFIEMRRTGVRPNQFTLTSLVCTATALGSIQYSNSIHAHISKLGFGSDTSVSNSLITMYMKIGSVEDGYRVFVAMTEHNLDSWNSLLFGFHDGDYCYQGPNIFGQMLVRGYNPNEYTYIGVLSSCSSLGDTFLGKQLHGHIIKNDLDNDCFVGTAVVDMYAKCGCLEDAHAVFRGMKERDLFTWTVILTGFANANQGEKSMKYYRQMQQEGLCPNEYTLSSCLRGCTDIAALENGRQLHSQIIKAGHLSDEFVLSALVDMYGKCGCINDAETVLIF